MSATQGRWISPDPVRSSWNAYAYPTDPNTQTDPTGEFSNTYSYGVGRSCEDASGLGSCVSLDGMWAEVGEGQWNDELGQKLQQYKSLQQNSDPIQQLMNNFNHLVFGVVFKTPVEVSMWGLSHWDLFQPFVDRGMAPTTVTVGWFHNTFANRYGHVAIGVGDTALVGLNPASDAQFIAYAALYEDACLGGLACDPMALTKVPGVISPQDPTKVAKESTTIYITADQGIAIQTAIGLSRDNPPPYSLGAPLPACDCGSWVQQMLSFGGINLSPPTWEPERVMDELRSWRYFHDW